MEIKRLAERDIAPPLFQWFERRQIVDKCWRKENGRWIIKSAPFIDDWSESDYAFLIHCLKNTVQTGGVVFGAFIEQKCKGFTSVESTPIGTKGTYLDLSCIHVSADMRGLGIGRVLFEKAADWAKQKGAEKLYISAHSAVETQAFYKAMGCKEAEEYNREHIEKEPFDCQLEYELTGKTLLKR